MGIADDISPRQKKHTAPAELYVQPSSVDAKKHHEKIDPPKPDKNDDKKDDLFSAKRSDTGFFPTPKVKDIKIEKAQSKKTKDVRGKSSFSWLQAIRNLIVIAVIATLSILIYQNFSRIKTLVTGQYEAETPEDSGAVTIVPQNYTSSSSSTSTTAPVASATTAPASTTTNSAQATTPAASQPAATTTPDKSTLTIDLLNGNGINNTAAIYKSVLSKAGYTVTAVGNAQNFHYWSTYVYYKTGMESMATDLKKVLARKSTLLKNDDTICKKYDIVIIIGSH